MNKEIEQSITAAAEKNYFEFVKNIDTIVQQKVDKHPGVQAYRDDLKYYQDFTKGLPALEPEKKDESEYELEN